MQLQYRKVKKLPVQTNSVRNLKLRQKFSKLMLELLHDGKRILNIDETWIGQTNYTRQLWRSPTVHASEPENLVTPRITMIVALDNHGDIYLSLMQSNTNQDTFCNYISHLVEQLDKDRPNWRLDTVI